MDTKLRKSRILRGCLGLLAVILAAVVNLGLFQGIFQEGQKHWEQENDVEDEYRMMVYQELLDPIYKGSYILNIENAGSYEAMYSQALMQEWDQYFSLVRDRVDYYATNGDGSRTCSNNSNNLGGILLTEELSRQMINRLSAHYSLCFRIHFDAEGIMTVESIFEEPGKGEGDWLIKNLQSIDRDNQNLTQDVYVDESMDWMPQKVERPKDFTIVWGIPYEYLHTFSAEAENMSYWERLSYYQRYGGFLLLAGTLGALLLAAVLLTSKHIWKERISYHRPGFCYGAELGVLAVMSTTLQNDILADWIHRYGNCFAGLQGPLVYHLDDPAVLLNMLAFTGILICFYGIWYLALLIVRPVFSLGLRQYVREYSLIYLVAQKVWRCFRRKWSALRYEIRHIDFSTKSMRTIRKVVILNFVALAVISCLWVIGIPVLVLYSGALFFFLKRQYDLAREDYRKLLSTALRMAEGDLNAIGASEDWGMFEPVKGELEKIRVGFGKAVEEEVKSQRMKTELISNVSHDLKTPLTAITTYVELLKNPEITPEERASYIDTLERKALRLKVLIEDLFEVSKATSNNIKLELMEVDVVNLLKQVSVEHTDKFEARGLELRWQLPEKAVCTLDSQKTYRIFENLFVNIEKYAMENSRVYVEVCQETEGENASFGQPDRRSKKTRIVLKNMSEAELNVCPQELTERFVRGDASRNTEGSGLGLAIVQSFVEAQGGRFWIEVDGDLFKALIEL